MRFEKRQNKCFFVFIDDPKLRSDIDDFFNNANVGVTDYKNALADLKIILHNL